jgi:hypothetical protein
MNDDIATIERQLARLEGKALLHGYTDAINTEIELLAGKLDELEQGAGEDWLMERDQESGRALKPFGADIGS